MDQTASTRNLEGHAGAPIVRARWLRRIGFVLLVYFLASVFTSGYLMGDTADYVESIVAFAAGRNFMFWEFGHLLWRPLGFLIFRVASPLTHLFGGADARLGTTMVLVSLSWLGGLISVLSLYGIVNRISRKQWVVITTTIAFIFAQAFLNYFQSGTPYIPGLSLLLLAIYLPLARDGNSKASPLTAWLAGACLAGSVLFWFPYVLAAPAVIVSPLFLKGFGRQRVSLALRIAIAFGVLIALIYLLVMAHIGIHNLQDFRDWMQMTTRAGSTPNKGVSKMVFGFARSFINMGNDGMLFKRFLVHDPFNPVSAWDLLRLSLWKLIGFYLFLVLIFLSLLATRDGRRVLMLLMVNGIPVIAFAVYWQGGDPERYFPLYPLIFIAFACSLDSAKARPVFKIGAVVFLLVALITNTATMATPRVNRQQEMSATRIRPLIPVWRPGSWVFAATWQDEIINFNRSFPFHPVNRYNNLSVGTIISPGEAQVEFWWKEIWLKAQTTWANDGDVWISKRLLARQPRPEWNWVEGDDPRVSWTDLYRYFSNLQTGQEVGGDDGFVLLLPSEQNRRYMSEYRKP